MAAVNVQLSGAGFANRDASVRLVNSATGQVIERKPFLDGSLLVRDVDPGLWQMTVSHPNLVTPIDQRVIRIFPQVPPTLVPVTISPDLFRDNPIRDIPDADLSPVQQTATDVRDRLRPVLGKSPGEAIRAEDWNVLVAGVSDLATAVLSLTSLVSPKGHDHPEIAEKIGEVQDNLRRFSQAFGNSLVELRREIETEVLRRNVNDVLALGQATEDTRARIIRPDHRPGELAAERHHRVHPEPDHHRVAAAHRGELDGGGPGRGRQRVPGQRQRAEGLGGGPAVRRLRHPDQRRGRADHLSEDQRGQRRDEVHHDREELTRDARSR